MRLLSASPRLCWPVREAPWLRECGCSRWWGGLAGTEEKRKEEPTEGREETDSPDGLDGDGHELCGDDGCEKNENGEPCLEGLAPRE